MVVKIIKSAAVAALERTLLGTDLRMPRNTALGKKFFSNFKTTCGRKTLLLKDDTRYIGAMNGALESQAQARHTKIIAGFSLLGLAVHLLTNRGYGYFRDELYFIACARHLDWGYVDFSPLSAWLLRGELILFGRSLFAVRILPAIASTLAIGLAGILAREMGGRFWAITLACTGMLGSLFFLAIGNFYSPNVYEPLFWTGAIYFLVRIINGAPLRTWLWFGLVIGLGLQNKHSMAFFGIAIAIAILFSSERKHLARKWIWLAAAIAVGIALPNVIWQVQRGWPTWVLLHGIAQSNKNVVLTPSQFFLQQITLMNPATFPIWFGGLIWLLVSREGRRYRVIAFAYLIALVEFILMHGKNYYLAGAYPMLFAAGGVAFERIFAVRLRWLRPAIAVLILGSAGTLAPVVLPILPPDKLLAYMRTIHFEVPRTETSHTAALPQLFADQFGWEEMVQSVARVYTSLPPDERKRAGIFCQNYGEAGAIDFFGPKYGLPPALSGHQNYFYWGPDEYTGEIMLVLDDHATDEREQFQSVQDRGPVETSPWAMPNEQRLHILICRGLKTSLRELWPKLRVWL
ncbi:MAG: glycosyltransferase [Verrucomicrobia bacterium]|nr:MAG: glycosyltransferase [Verrucomicrobiota bacterium]